VAAAKYCHRGFLQHTWPRYLPIRSSGASFLEPARKDILRLLRTEAVLQCMIGKLTMPSSLIYVPKDFKDKEGLPILTSPANERRYLSNIYKDSDYEYLSELGVQKMSSEIFLLDLKNFIIQDTAVFEQGKSDKWHCRLAEVLLNLVLQDRHRPVVKTLRIIPLSNGRWVSSTEPGVFLPQETDHYVVPDGICVHLVNANAANDRTRRSLYSQLGINALSDVHICNLITDTHTSPKFDPWTMSPEQLISQTMFLFNTGWMNPLRRDLWFASETERPYHPGSTLYIPSTEPFSASYFFGSQEAHFPFLHGEYRVEPENRGRWLEWLEKCMNLSILPRLVQTQTQAPRNFEIASDFVYITQHRHTSEFLLLLRDHWRHYSDWLEEDERPSNENIASSKKRLREKLGTIRVECVRGGSAPLNETFLPLPELMREAGAAVQFVDVPEPEDDRWSRLKRIGIGIEGDVRFYLRCLASMSGSRDPQAGDRATALLEQIQARYLDDETLVKYAYN
jgi:hypothetical protein